ncbi:LytR/AlgR family response regulator transcription factor [Mucilaginibacter paludis]|uniref:Two component transcriptional regulator, LytTR family n=1 Tax=Mucilaginibacter paludis DSM 18603 TaxID=714943 RepID=H1YAD4_9SPHI|nr:LytTR family DNA-binding domain-containing protein [Mucilaginibacter paludis]EHQ26977.1 two component transcriptional regulator, LytTR family [Mucilaginibacter paludis DSM 18603]
MLTCIAIDDEPIALEIINAYASKVPFLMLKAEFEDAFDAIAWLQREPVDLIFLDVKMPDISGLEFYNSLNKKPLVIFTTAYSEHAVSSFELDAVDFLLKPFSLSRFIKACNKANELHGFRNAASPKDHLFVKSGQEQLRIGYDELHYLEATGNYVTFVTADKKIVTRMTITEARLLLPEEKFIRIHRSFIAAPGKMAKIERHQVTMLNKDVLPVGLSYLDTLNRLKK